MSKITLEFANYIEFFEFIRKTHEFIDAVSHRNSLEDQINQIGDKVMAFKDDVIAKVMEVKQAIADAVTTEINQVKAVIEAKLTAAGVSDADKADILAAVDGIKGAAVTGIDSVSDSV